MTTFAPYNFVPFSNVSVPQRYERRNDLPSHGEAEADALTGRIEYTFTAVTPIAVGGVRDSVRHKSYFCRDAKGNFMIPGSSVRGFVRSHAEMLSFSYPDMIDDTDFMYRKFAGRSKKLRTEYGDRLKGNQGSAIRVPDGVKAGWISCDRDGHYFMQPVKGFGSTGTTFFQIHERDLRLAGVLNPNQYMYTGLIDKFYTTSTVKAVIDSELEAYNRTIKNLESPSYRPYRGSVVSFDYINNRIQNIGSGAFTGRVLNSERMHGKTHHYLVSEEKTGTRFEIKREQILDYEKDYNRNCIQNGKLKRYADFYALPEKGKEKLFFYKKGSDPERLAGFGPTPYFRIFFDYSTREGIPMTKGEGFDYVSSMFGYVGHGSKKASEAYRGRISFGDARLNTEKRTSFKDALLAGPKGTSVHMYLDQTGKNKDTLSTYNDPDMELRGYKFYWKRSEIPASEGRENVMSHLETLPAGSVFKGDIWFENLSEDELGLLLLSLRISDDEASHESYLIGGGKPYGLGQVRPGEIRLHILDQKKRFTEVNISEEDRTSQIPSIKNKFKSVLRDTYHIDLEEQDTWKVLKKYAEQENMDYCLGQEVYMALQSRRGEPARPNYASYEPLPTAAQIMNTRAAASTVSRTEAPAAERRTERAVSPGSNRTGMVWFARYKLSKKQEDLTRQYGAAGRCEKVFEWCTTELLEEYAGTYQTVLLPGKTRRDILDKAKELFDQVYVAVKTGDYDSDWKKLK